MTIPYFPFPNLRPLKIKMFFGLFQMQVKKSEKLQEVFSNGNAYLHT